MRSLSSAAVAALQAAGDQERTFLIELDFSGGIQRFSTGTRDLDALGQIWSAVGGALLVGQVEESRDAKGAGVDLVLSGVDQSIANTLLTENFRGRTMKVWQALLDPVDGTVVDTIQLFDGLQLDNYEVKEVAQRGRPMTITIRTRGRHRLGVAEYRGIRANLHSHQQLFDGDTFFTHVASLSGRRIFWGVTSPLGPIGPTEPGEDGDEDEGA